MTAADLPRWYQRELTRATWLVIWAPLCLLWLLMGVISIHRLGKVLEKTGLNLQTYDW